MTEATNNNPFVVVDGKKYLVSSLSDDCKRLLYNIQVADQRIAQFQQDALLIQAARNGFAADLTKHLPDPVAE